DVLTIIRDVHRSDGRLTGPRGRGRRLGRLRLNRRRNPATGEHERGYRGRSPPNPHTLDPSNPTGGLLFMAATRSSVTPSFSRNSSRRSTDLSPLTARGRVPDASSLARQECGQTVTSR